jgi:hypothetical protein
MRPHQLSKSPRWHQRASRAEIHEVASIDKLIDDLRARRHTIINRANVRTRIWTKHHQEKNDGATMVALVPDQAQRDRAAAGGWVPRPHLVKRAGANPDSRQ